MKKFSCLILSFIMAFSLIPLNALAVEDTGEVSSYEESEENSEDGDAVLQGSEDAADSTVGNSADENSAGENSEKAVNEEDETVSEVPEEEVPEEGEDSEENQDPDEDEDGIGLLDADQDNPDETGTLEWTQIDLPQLEYDDRYSLEDLSEISGANENYVISEIITNESESFQVDSGNVTGNPDEVITQASDGSLDIIATGVGSASIYLVPVDAEGTDESTEDPDPAEDTSESTENPDPAGDTKEPEPVENGIKANVTVESATLTLMYLIGQSNMEGRCSDSTYDLNASVACQEGTVYSTYAPTTSNSKGITGLTFSDYCDADNASDFVAGSLQSDKSVSGESLTYALDSLTTKGSGKAGPDSGLAYKWNELTGEKVWVINTAWAGTGIASWAPNGTQYKRSSAVWKYVDQVYQAELEAGHYNEDGRRLAFWLQGESDTSAQTTTEDYISDFTSMYTSMKNKLGLDAFGIIMVRGSGTGDSTSGAYTTDKDLKMSNPRIAQYAFGGSNGLSGVYVVSNANEQWVTDAGVKSYFQTAYPEGSLSYPTHSGSKSLPTTVSAVHNDVHYSQIGHNENGITAAYGMYQALSGSAVPAEVQWRDEDGQAVTSLSLLLTGDTGVLVPVTDPVYAAKEVSYSVSGSAATFDVSIGTVTAKAAGTSKITASYNGNTLSTVSVSVTQSTDLSSVAGKNYTGLYKYNGIWWYLEKGIIQPNYEGVVKNENGWWYVNNGMVDFTYTGFAENSNGWWYIEDGKVTFNKNSVIKDTNKKIDGAATWWYVVGSKVQKSFTGLADYKNSNGWWYISKGKVTFDVTTVAKNKNGWYYVKDSKVDFSYNGFEKNSNGWWYLENGKVTFNKNSVIKDNNKKIDGAKTWWYVVGSKVQTGFTGLANYKNSNGWWYIKNGKVDFTANTVAKNKNGWWYVLGGKVQFGFTGLADYKNANGWWYINNGKVTFNVNTVAKNKNGWWYVKNSKVDFGFNGIASNSNGRWYLKKGKVDFTYNGTCNYNGKRYTIVNGKVK